MDMDWDCTNWTDTDRRLLGIALGSARAELRMQDARRKPRGPEIVFEVIKFIADVDRRLPKAGPPREGRIRWDYVHDRDERVEAGKQRMIDWKAGDWSGHLPAVGPREIAKAEAAQKIFRSCLVGQKQVRDFKILFALAQGKSVRKVAKQFKVSHPRIIDRRDLQCAAIWKRVEHLMDQSVSKQAA